LHYYFSFIDEELGLSYVGVPTCLPRRLQCSGHNWLAAQLRKSNFDYRLQDNAFVEIGDWRQAQAIADGWRGRDRIARGEHTRKNRSWLAPAYELEKGSD